ncbi:hypothetical protein SAY86_028067 [Trapa natans]|uniref:Uncharacterized protein n=1 Tax=Trapa natans TaxID=22666 RepID=A0AAN7MGZ4_TRANT|nr:hypothetical protein SAY86_028067 [Trapa natans]
MLMEEDMEDHVSRFLAKFRKGIQEASKFLPDGKEVLDNRIYKGLVSKNLLFRYLDLTAFRKVWNFMSQERRQLEKRSLKAKVGEWRGQRCTQAMSGLRHEGRLHLGDVRSGDCAEDIQLGEADLPQRPSG